MLAGVFRSTPAILDWRDCSLIYPLNVHKQSQRSSKVASGDMSRLVLAFTLIGAVALFFLIDWAGGTFLSMPTWASFVVTIVVTLILVSLIIRFLVFDEAELMQEYSKEKSDSFSKYIYIRKDDITNVEVANRQVNCYSFTNGSGLVALQFKYGSNDQETSKDTLIAFERIFHVLSENSLAFRTIDVPEDFEQSDEYRRYVSGINSIEDKKLAKHLLRVADNVLRISEELSDVSTIYLLISNKSSVQTEGLEIALRQIFSIVTETPNAFRHMDTLDEAELLEMLRRFYNLEAMDFGMMRVVELSQEVNIDFSKAVSIYRIETTDGKAYTSNEVLDARFNSATRRL